MTQLVEDEEEEEDEEEDDEDLLLNFLHHCYEQAYCAAAPNINPGEKFTKDFLNWFDKEYATNHN